MIMSLILAVAVILVVFVAGFLVVQWGIARSKRRPLDERADVRRTLQNAAQTLGGSDYLRQYPPIDEPEPRTRHV